MTTTHPQRPALHEADYSSYLTGSLDFYPITGADQGVIVHSNMSDPAGLVFAGRDEASYAPLMGTLCRACAYAHLVSLGGTVVTAPHANGPGGWADEGEVVLITVDGTRYLAEFVYGRCCFEPNEPRTQPCDACGTEILLDALA